MTLTHEDVRKILEILDESDCEEVYLEFGDLKVRLRKHGDSPDPEKPAHTQASPQAADTVDEEPAAPAAPARREPGQEVTIPAGVLAVTAPMLGTFYRAPTPGARPFVEVGDKVQPDDTVCLVEVMKLFNSVRAGTAGTIERILVENAALVEYGQPLILIRKGNT
ncbi:MAG: acetyl-CoA carboxylase, biotin carboxyl carrier protein [Betaproteobacteria bacterium RIFCSPLOWO2_12_FULL_62_13]|nr:MAG: acetyl-CoA carboxylase, biotin carboxyl carrier protein [Betaproteobacteria bacterium RIFCSPLOWO2_12_FULL_62_13]